MFYKCKKIKKLSKRYSEGVIFNQETFTFNQCCFTNLYWLQCKKGQCSFSLINIITPSSLINIIKKYSTNKTLGAINTGQFFLSDDDFIPKLYTYNTLVKKGNILQFPHNTRPHLIERNGSLEIMNLKAQGYFNISKKRFKWYGSSYKINLKQNECIVYGIFDVEIDVIPKEDRTFRETNMDSLLFSTNVTEVLIGFLKKGETTYIANIDNKLNMGDYLFIIKGNKYDFNDIKIGDVISEVEIDKYQVNKMDNIIAGNFLIPYDPAKIQKQISDNTILDKKGKYRALEYEFRKAWSVILETRTSFVFFTTDARPYIAEQKGLNIYELQDVLRKKFKYIHALVCDAGQTTRLCLKNGNSFSIYCNKHYINYSSELLWDGLHGRKIPSALLINYK